MANPNKRRRIDPLPPSQAQSVAVVGGIPLVAKAKPGNPLPGDSAARPATEPKPDEMEERLPSEKDLGMTAFLDKERPSFVAIFKQRRVLVPIPQLSACLVDSLSLTR